MSSSFRKHDVFLTAGAEQDLQSIYEYIAEYDSISHANHVLDALTKLIDTLSKNPERGNYPKELISLGIKEYRQAFFKPYRVIYRVVDKQVIIYLIADGRRDMQSILARRLLNS